MALTRTETEERIFASLRSRNGVATLGDAVADTGLPSDDVENSLARLLKQYASHLDVDDSGALRYRFDPSFARRGETVTGRWWRRFSHRALRAFRWFTKGWIMVVLVGYTVTFIVLLAVAAIASIFADEDGGLAALPLYLLVRVLEALFWIDLSRSNSRFGSRLGNRQKKLRKPTVPFYRRVFNFVLGPESGNDLLEAQRGFTAFVRAHEGTVTAADWAAYSGSSLEVAENALTAAALRFRAKVDLTNDGALLYRFDELVLSASVRELGDRQKSGEQNAADTSVPIWERPARSAPLTGNSWGWNLWIATLNVFNLLMASLFLSIPVSNAVTIALGYVPLGFGVFFFAVPFTRLVGRLLNASSRAREDERRNLMQEVFESARAGVPARLPAADESGHTDRRSRRRRRRVAAILPQVVADLEGEPVIGMEAGGAGVYRFDKLALNLLAAEKARGAKEGGLRFGETIFSSEDDARTWDKRDLADFDRRLARELAGPTSG